MPVSRSPLDKVFSDLVRLRANYICEHCGRGDSDKALLHCAHIVGRKWKGGRWWGDNAVCLHASCHAYFTDHPWEFGVWCNSYLGEGRREILNERRRMQIKYTEADRKDMLKHYRAEYRRMVDLRAAGEVGRIEFVGWY